MIKVMFRKLYDLELIECILNVMLITFETMQYFIIKMADPTDVNTAEGSFVFSFPRNFCNFSH